MKKITDQEFEKNKIEKLKNNLNISGRLSIFIKIGLIGMVMGVIMIVLDYSNYDEISDVSMIILIASWVIYIIPKVWSDNIEKKLGL